MLVGAPDGRVSRSSAAEVLRRAADAERNLAPPLPGPGQYLYVKSQDAYLSSTVTLPSNAKSVQEIDGGPPRSIDPEEAVTPEIDYSILRPSVREVWIGAKGSLLEQHFRPPEFITENDREAWVADGRAGVKSMEAGTSTDSLGKNEPLDIPADPSLLLDQLRAKAGRYAHDIYPPPDSSGASQESYDPVDVEVFSLIGEDLRERSATPAQRSALFEAASRLNGIELVGDVTDSVGRPGIAVAMTDPRDGIRDTFIFDPNTSVLLAEEEVIADDDNTYGYPVGTVIGHSTYLERAIVDKAGERP